MLAPAADGTSAREDFGDTVVADCFIPQIAFSTVLWIAAPLAAGAFRTIRRDVG